MTLFLINIDIDNNQHTSSGVASTISYLVAINAIILGISICVLFLLLISLLLYDRDSMYHEHYGYNVVCYNSLYDWSIGTFSSAITHYMTGVQILYPLIELIISMEYRYSII